MFALFASPIVFATQAVVEDPQLRREREIGRRAVEQIEQHWDLIADPVRIAHLSMIADRLTPFLERDIQYEVRILNTEIPNAFAIPGGFIFFTTGMLELLSSDAEIAAIMAHEMVHIDQAHGIRMAARQRNLTLASLAAIVLSGGAAAPAILAQVAQVAMTSAYSIEFEIEADLMGMDMLIAAGYSPSAMLTVMEKLVQLDMKRPIRDFGIYMTHPEATQRARMIREGLRSQNIPLQRKIPLQLLRTSVRTNGERISLLMDNVEVWGGHENTETRYLLMRAQALLDRDFQMEMPPFDLRLEGDGENGLLRLRNSVLAEAPLPEGMACLAEFRGNLLAALARAQSRHPVANFLN